MDLEQLKESIAARLDVEQILDILGFSTYELVEALEEQIEEFTEEFKAALDE